MKAGWKTVKFGEVARYDKAQGVHSGLPYVGLEHIESGTRKHIGARIDTEVQSSTFLFNPKHVLYGRLRPYLRKVLVPEFAGHCSTEIFPILPSSELDRSFLSYWLISESTTSAIDRLCNGARMPRANMEQVLELEIPLPPLAEQKRIVALLDEAFAGIDEAKAKAEANLENGIALFQSHLNSLFAQCGETWIEKPLDEVLVKTETIDPTRNPKAEFDYIDVSSVSKEELVVQQTQRLLGKDAPSRARKLVRANDVIFATIRPTLRRIAIIPGELDGQVCSTGYFVLRPKGEIDHRWVFYFLQTDAFLAEMERLQKGASYPAVTDSDVRSQMIPMPSLGNQKVALEKLDDLRKETLLVSNLFEKKVLNLTELKSSLLAQAFAGELAV